jgi:hypothetical protein
MDWADPAGAPVDGTEQVRVEWTLLEGSRQKGKFTQPYTLTTKNRLANDLVDALVDHLNGLFPTADFRDRDVILWGA